MARLLYGKLFPAFSGLLEFAGQHFSLSDDKAIADQILRKWTGIIAYDVGKYGAMWLVWAATTNTFFGVINIFAATWEHTAKMAVIYGDLFVYGVLLLPAIAVVKNENYSKGHFINILLGIFWILWGIYALFAGS